MRLEIAHGQKCRGGITHGTHDLQIGFELEQRA
jgi:hypothetical protein